MASARSLALLCVLALGCSTGAKPEAMAPGGRAVPSDFTPLDAERLADVPTLSLRTTGGRGTNPERFDQPFWGWLDMEVTLGARWRLCEAEGDRLVWERLVESAYTATEQDSGLGIRRLRLANEGAARGNIADGVSALVRLAPKPTSGPEG